MEKLDFTPGASAVFIIVAQYLSKGPTISQGASWPVFKGKIQLIDVLLGQETVERKTPGSSRASSVSNDLLRQN